MQNKKTNYKIELKSSDLKVIEEKIINSQSGDYKVGRKIKNQFGATWINEEQFLLLFQEKNNFFLKEVINSFLEA